MTTPSPAQPLLSSSIQRATTWTLKVELDGEVRRARDVNIEADTDDPLSILCATVGSLFDLNSDQVAALHFKYRDTEAELCTLVNATFADALSLAGSSHILRLQASIKLPSDTAAGVAGPLASADTQDNGSSTDSVQPNTLRKALTERLSVVHSSVTEHIAEAHCNITSRLDRTRPGLGEGLACFTKQIQKDFETGRKDMRDAFTKGSQEDNTTSQVASVASGVVMATRFVPVRLTRLATKSVAAFMGAPADSNSSEPPDAVVMGPGESIVETIGNNQNEFDNFKQLVARDFCMARDEIKAAVNDVVGPDGLTVPNFRRECQIPTVVGTVAGATVAATLLPLRGATLAVASLTGRVVATPDANGAAASVSQDTSVSEVYGLAEPSTMESASGESVSAINDNVELRQEISE